MLTPSIRRGNRHERSTVSLGRLDRRLFEASPVGSSSRARSAFEPTVSLGRLDRRLFEASPVGSSSRARSAFEPHWTAAAQLAEICGVQASSCPSKSCSLAEVQSGSAAMQSA